MSFIKTKREKRKNWKIEEEWWKEKINVQGPGFNVILFAKCGYVFVRTCIEKVSYKGIGSSFLLNSETEQVTRSSKCEETV